MKKNLLIAIDGPSASGKGTLAKRIAQHFAIPYLNTGALYRLLALRAIEKSFAENLNDQNIDLLIANLQINENELENEELFSEKVAKTASLIAKNIKIRKALFDFQRQFAIKNKEKYGGAVLDGRDTTTVICPDADYKFFVTAAVEIRAKRRFEQLKKSQDTNVNYQEILAQLKQRDENDYSRQEAPLQIAKDAIIIDNSNLSIEEGFLKILTSIELQ
jgi:cytidylate kinase